MAFLCPSRAGRNKKKKEVKEKKLGRITGSDSVETLVRVGYEKKLLCQGHNPDSQRIILQDFTPCAVGEIQVHQGQKVTLLYRENDWAYVIAGKDSEGFVPFSLCSSTGNSFSKPVSYKRLGTDQLASSWCSVVTETITNTNDSYITENWSDFSYSPQQKIKHNRTHVQTNLQDIKNEYDRKQTSGFNEDVHHNDSKTMQFCKTRHGDYIAMFVFDAQEENDINVIPGEIVTVLNLEDPSWCWVQKGNNTEGFVPTNFLHPLEIVMPRNGFENTSSTHRSRNDSRILSESTLSQSSSPPGLARHSSTDSPVTSDSTFTNATNDSNISEYVSMYDYSPKRSDGMSVKRGELLLVDSREQMENEWFWAYSPKFRRYGYIPKNYVKLPLKTAI